MVVENGPALEFWRDVALAGAALEALPVSVCVLDARGTVSIANRAWQTLRTASESLRELAPEGGGFVAACERATTLTGSQRLAAATRQLICAERGNFSMRLSCGESTQQQWFLAKAARLPGDTVGYIVTIEDITVIARAEQGLAGFDAIYQTQRQQAQQHALLAQFGQFALENPPLPELTALAVEIVRRGLGVDLCRLLETSLDDKTLLHSAGLGWDEQWVQANRFDVVTETQDRFILGARESVIVADYATERRIRASPIQSVHHVRSSVEVLVCGASGTYGVIGAYAREPRRFDASSANFMQNISNTLAAFIERKATEDRMAYMAQFDALTGLPNRSLYLDRLEHTLVGALRDKRPVAVLFVDIDHFKSVNDTLGHSAGDALLVKIAERLRAATRSGDTIGRLSGDEFAISLAHLAREDHAGIVARKVVNGLAAPFAIDGHSVYVSASIGVSVYPSDGTEPDVLLKNADTAMYRAKQGGRNAYQFYLPDMQIRASERLRLETELRGALDRDEFVLHYQPKINLLDGSLSGLEALLRWQSPERGLVSPGEFIPVLEEAGLILGVGEWVIASVCTQVNRWQRDGLAVQPVAVNVSARQFREQHFEKIIDGSLTASGIEPQLLELELTESILMSDSESAVETLRKIKARGIRLALDDFGTGYSSLSYLKRFPLDSLKIDRSFIGDVTTNSDDASIVLAIINLARSLELDVTAEGVETRDQLQFLRRHGCDEAQGYLLARPMPVEAMTRVLREGGIDSNCLLEWQEPPEPAVRAAGMRGNRSPAGSNDNAKKGLPTGW